MINSKITKSPTSQQSSEEKLFKLLEGIDWKLWEMYNMLKNETSKKTTTTKPSSKKSTKESVENE